MYNQARILSKSKSCGRWIPESIELRTRRVELDDEFSIVTSIDDR